MIDSLKILGALAKDHWEQLVVATTVILWGRNDYRISQLENSAKKRTIEDCDELMAKCSNSNNMRFNDGRREFDGFTAALNRLADHIEDNNKLILNRIDKLTDHVIGIKEAENK